MNAGFALLAAAAAIARLLRGRASPNHRLLGTEWIVVRDCRCAAALF
jgi:hypothetical protein